MPVFRPMRLIVDAILGLVAVEALGLALYNGLTGNGPAPRAYLANLAAGFLLLLVVRLSLSDAPSWALAASLFGALCAHLLDLSGRWRSR